MSRQQTLLLSITICLGWMALVMLGLNPVFMAQEEIGIQDRLTGADGLPPSYLTHFNHGWHYWISWLVFKAFSSYPEFNWYALFLTLIQGVAISTIGYSIIRRAGGRTGSCLFLIYLLFISTPFLLSLNLTGTSVQLALAGLLLFWREDPDQYYRSTTWLSALFLIVAGMLRMHTIALVLLAACPYIIFSMRFSKAIKSGKGVLLALPVILLLNLIHVQHFRKEIPDWDKQEQLRQAIFKIANHPIHPNYATEETKCTGEFLMSNVTWDSLFVTSEKLEKLYARALRPRDTLSALNNPELYWLIKNNLYLIALCLTISIIVMVRDRRSSHTLIPGIFISILLAWILWTWFKLTAEIIQTIAGVNVLAGILSLNSSNERNTRWGFAKILSILSLFLLSIWGVRVVDKLNRLYSSRAASWENIQREINAHPKSFFIVTEMSGVKRSYPICTSPNQFPIPNTLTRQCISFHHIGHINKYYEALEQKNSDSSYQDILFVGDSTRIIESVYPLVKFSPPLPEFKYMKVRRVEK